MTKPEKKVARTPSSKPVAPTAKRIKTEGYFSTGLSSAVQRQHDQRLKKMQNRKAGELAGLAPDAKILLEWIEEEKKDVVNLEKMILNISDEKFVQAQLLARQMHLDWLTKMKKKVNTVLRATADPVVQGESFDEK